MLKESTAKLNFVFEQLVVRQLSKISIAEKLNSVYFAKSIVVRRRSSISPFSVRRQPPFASRRRVFASSPAPPVRHQTLIGSPADVLRRLRRRQQ